jgi:hypothetical protein
VCVQYTGYQLCFACSFSCTFIERISIVYHVDIAKNNALTRTKSKLTNNTRTKKIQVFCWLINIRDRLHTARCIRYTIKQEKKGKKGKEWESVCVCVCGGERKNTVFSYVRLV